MEGGVEGCHLRQFGIEGECPSDRCEVVRLVQRSEPMIGSVAAAMLSQSFRRVAPHRGATVLVTPAKERVTDLCERLHHGCACFATLFERSPGSQPTYANFGNEILSRIRGGVASGIHRDTCRA
jgi:hypothetical protein